MLQYSLTCPSPAVEKVIFLVALAAAAYGFWLRFGKVVARIRAAKPDPDFSIHPIGKRIWDFFWEVMCQAKVIRERPLPGLAHAFVFWGFCVFALITLNHFATGARLPDSRQHVRRSLPEIRRRGSACWWRSRSPDLFIRRFFVRPQWLGELSKESGVIAFLIFALMITFILAVAVSRNTKSPCGGRTRSRCWPSCR